MPLSDQNYPLSQLIVSTYSSSNAFATLTLPAGGAGTYHYITSLRCNRIWYPGYTNQAATIQTTNMNGLVWLFPQLASLTQTSGELNMHWWPPLRCATANTATNFGMVPAGTNIQWNGVCTYYLGCEDR